MSNVGTFFLNLKNKLESSPFLNGNEQVSFVEDTDLLQQGLVFPRINLLVDKIKGNGYESQRQMDVGFRFIVVGHLKIDGPDAEEWKPTAENCVELIDFGISTMSLIFSMLDDKQSGEVPCKGFEMFSGFPELFIEPELIPKILSFTIVAEAKILQDDTEE